MRSFPLRRYTVLSVFLLFSVGDCGVVVCTDTCPESYSVSTSPNCTVTCGAAAACCEENTCAAINGLGVTFTDICDTVSTCQSVVRCNDDSVLPTGATIKLTCLVSGGAFTATGCLEKVACKGLTQDDVPSVIQVDSATEGLGDNFIGYCEGSSMEDCAQLSLTSPYRFFKVECRDEYVCRSSDAACGDEPSSNGGILTENPDLGDAGQHGFLYFCLCGDDCWNASRPFTPYTADIADYCHIPTPSATLTQTLPTATPTISPTHPLTATSTLATVTPSAEDRVDTFTSSLVCQVHSIPLQTFMTGKSTVCIFTARDADGLLVRTHADAQVHLEVTGTTRDLVRAVQAEGETLGVYKAVLPPFAAEGLYHVVATYASDAWAHLTVQATNTLSVEQGYPEGMVIRCPPEGTQPGDASFPFVSACDSTDCTLPFVAMGATLLCEVTPTVADCPNCRLLLPLEIAFADAGWNVSSYPSILQTGVDSLLSPTPVVYGFVIRNMDLNANRTLDMRVSVLPQEKVALMLEEESIRLKRVAVSGQEFLGALEFDFVNIVSLENQGSAAQSEAVTAYSTTTSQTGAVVYMTFAYAFETDMSAFQMICPASPFASNIEEASVSEPIAAAAVPDTKIYSKDPERYDERLTFTDYNLPNASGVSDIRYCYVRAVSTASRVVVPALLFPETYVLRVSSLFQNISSARGPSESPFFTTNFKNVYTTWGQDGAVVNDLMAGAIVFTKDVTPSTTSAQNTPVTCVGIGAEWWGTGTAEFYFRETEPVVYMGTAPPLYESNVVSKPMPLTAFARSAATSLLSCAPTGSASIDATLAEYYANLQENQDLVLFPSYPIGCSLRMKDAAGQIVPGYRKDIAVEVAGDERYVTVGGLEKKFLVDLGFAEGVDVASDPFESEEVSFGYEFTLETQEFASDIFSRFATKHAKLSLKYTPRRTQDILAQSSAYLNFYNSRKSLDFTDARENPFSPYFPLISEWALEDLITSASPEVEITNIVIGAIIDPLLEVFANNRAVVDTHESSAEGFILSAVLTGKGSDAVAFTKAAIVRSWVCHDTTDATNTVYTSSEAYVSINATVVRGLGVDSLLCTATLSWSDPREGNAPPEFVPTTGTLSESVTVTFNVFETKGKILAAMNEVDAVPIETTDTIVVADSIDGSVLIECTGFEDTNTPLSYVLRVYSVADDEYEDVTEVQENARFTFNMPKISPVAYGLAVWCVGVDVKGAEAYSVNTVDIIVGKNSMPSETEKQDRIIERLYKDVTVGVHDFLFYAKVLQQLEVLTNASASALVRGTTSTLAALHKALPGTTKDSSPTHTALIAEAVNSAAQVLKIEVTHDAKDGDREDAFLAMAQVLRSIRVGSVIYRSAVLMMARAVDGMREVLSKQTFKTPAPAPSTARTASSLALSQGQDEEMAGSVIDTMCVSGVSLGLALAPGSCTSISVDEGQGLTFTACALHVADLLLRPVESAFSSMQFTTAAHNDVKVPVDTPVIVVIGSVQHQYYGFDASSRALLGRVSSLCVYNRDTDSFLEADDSVVHWDFRLRDSYRLWKIPESATGAIYSQSRFDIQCENANASVDTANGPHLEADCSGFHTAPMVAAPVASGAICLPDIFEGCDKTNEAGDIAFCRCTLCGNGFIPTPFAAGLLCRKELRYRCDSVAHVTDALLCQDSSLIDNQCRCLPGLTCRGTPGVCTLNKKCDEIGTGYECVESHLIHDPLTQTCKCKPHNESDSLFCDNGACRRTLGCGESAAAGGTCGYGSTSENGICVCPKTHHCSHIDKDEPARCEESGRCSEHPPQGDASLCLQGLSYSQDSLGTLDDASELISFVVSTTSLAIKHPVSSAAEFSEALEANLMAALRGGDIVHSTDKSISWKIVPQSITFRVEPPTTALGVSSFFSVVVVLARELEDSGILEALLGYMGVSERGTAQRCVVADDAAKGVPCVFSATNIEAIAVDHTLPGVCVCADDLLCVAKKCTCPKCQNGGECRWPENGLDEHSCVCPKGWQGNACQDQEEAKPRGIVYIFPDAVYDEYLALSDGNKTLFASAARSIIDEESSGVAPDYRMHIYRGSIRIAVEVTMLDSTWAEGFADAASFETAAKLRNGLSVFLKSSFGIPSYDLKEEQDLCPAVVNCVELPAHWTTPACQCLGCATGYLLNANDDNKTCIPDTLCSTADCSLHGKPSGYVSLGCICECAENFRSNSTDAPLCDIDTCLDSIEAWQGERCGVLRCSARSDGNTDPGDVVGECTSSSSAIFSIGSVGVVISVGVLCAIFAFLVGFYTHKKHMPWESKPEFKYETADDSDSGEGVEMDVADLMALGAGLGDGPHTPVSPGGPVCAADPLQTTQAELHDTTPKVSKTPSFDASLDASYTQSED